MPILAIVPLQESCSRSECRQHYGDGDGPDNILMLHVVVIRYSAALSDCLAALELSPDFSKARLRAVKCYCHLGQLKQAKALLDQAQKEPAVAKEV